MGTVGTIADLDRRFGMPGIAKVVAGNGGLPKVCITSSQAEGEMYLHGAHVTSWKPLGGEEVLFVSSRSHWGGVALFVAVCQFAFPGLERRRTIPMRRRMASRAPKRGSSSRSCREATRLP